VEMDRGRLLWFGTLECLKLAEFRGLEVAWLLVFEWVRIRVLWIHVLNVKILEIDGSLTPGSYLPVNFWIFKTH
jgi:hypothetical protein